MNDSDLWLSESAQQATLAWQAGDGLDDVRRVAVERIAGLTDARRQLDVDVMISLLAFCDAYRTVPECPVEGGEQLIALGGDGCPLVAEFAVMELSARLGLTMLDVRQQLTDAQDLAYRFPLLFKQVVDCQVPVWQAAKVTRECRELTAEQASRIDEALARAGWQSLGRVLRKVRGLIAVVAPELAAEKHEKRHLSREFRMYRLSDDTTQILGRIDPVDGRYLEATVARLAEIFAEQGDTSSLDARRARAVGLLAFPARALAAQQAAVQPELWTSDGASDGEPECLAPQGGLIGHLCGQVVVDPEKLLPCSSLVVHVAAESLESGEGVARIEGIGPILVSQLRDVLGDTRVRVTPVIDAESMAPFDSYEIPDRMRAAVLARNPVEVFPGSGQSSRRCQLDHTIAYQRAPGAPPGQTDPANLGPLGTLVHRGKTHGQWQLDQQRPGEFTWTSPLGYRYRVTPQHTEFLGNGLLGTERAPVDFSFLESRVACLLASV